MDVNIMGPRGVQGPATGDSAAARRVLEGETFGTVLLVLFCDSVGDELDHDGKPLGYGALQWHPSTIRHHLESHWGVTLPRINLDKLMAAVAVVTTDLFFKNADRFIKLCNVLSGSEFDHDTFDPADAVECAWGCTEALLLHPPGPEDPEPFSDEVRHYVTQVLDEEGYVKPPDILRIAVGADRSARVASDFADDPGMFAGINAVQDGKTQEVEDAVRSGLLELVDQLKSLPLRHGTAAELEERVARMIRGTAEKPLH